MLKREREREREEGEWMLLRASEHNMQDRKEDGEQEEENGVGLGRVAPSS